MFNYVFKGTYRASTFSCFIKRTTLNERRIIFIEKHQEPRLNSRASKVHHAKPIHNKDEAL